MANNFQAKLTDRPTKTSGRDQEIDNARLCGQRDSLVFLIETTWPEIGGRLSKIKKASHVQELVKVWEEKSAYTTCYVAQLLVRPGEISSDTTALREMRDRADQLHEGHLRAEKLRDEASTRLDTARRGLISNLSTQDRNSVEEQIARRFERLVEAEKALRVARDRDRQLQEQIQKGEANFARKEFADFCQSKRYRLTPLNLANAMAGLPYIGWRRSIERCQTTKSPGAGGGAMQEFDVIRQIIRSGTRRSRLVKHAEQWLISKGKTKSHAIVGLKRNWYYLRRAIQAALDAQTRTRDLPFAITKDYRERQTHASNVDRLFAESEAL